MANAKQEFLSHISETGKNVKCCIIQFDPYSGKKKKDILLKENYTEQDFQKFLKRMDFEYDKGYGLQELYGNIWFEDGTFSKRGEYDGSEWWEHVETPVIPEELRG